MRFSVKGCFIVSLHICTLSQVSSLVYNELRNLNVSCYPTDSCHPSTSLSRTTDDTKTCECDVSCYRRGTCCIDSPYVDPRPSTRQEICSGERIMGVTPNYYFNDSRSFGFFQVAQCDPRWGGSLEIWQLCEMEDPVDGVDLMIAIPVTNTYSGISYKNYFCALCNNDIEDAVFWDVDIYEENYKTLINDRFSVQASNEDSVNNGESGSCNDGNTAALVYNEDERYYGYWDYCSYEIPRFVRVTVTLSVPNKIQNLIKGCRLNLISRCSPNWTGVRTRILCGAYLGIIKGPPQEDEFGIPSFQYFRNAHCALCNNVTNMEGYSCEPFSAGALITRSTYETSETSLFAQLLSNEECFGDSERFIEGFSCTAVVCANPQYKVKNGACAP